jgi:energy-coupling factor transporter ATP-binding protein EcfA2
VKLYSLTYSQNTDEPKAWKIESLTFGPVNLLVGKNASGKTMALTIINALAKLLSGKGGLTFKSGNWDVMFQDGSQRFHYILEVQAQKVVREEYTSPPRTYMKRTAGGRGHLLFRRPQKKRPTKKTPQRGRMLPFQAPDSSLAAILRRDSIQHPFFERLFKWGKSVYCYSFGTTLGRDFLSVLKGEQADRPREARQNQLTDAHAIHEVFREGETQFGEQYKQSILKDMKAVGYELEDVGLSRPVSVTLSTPLGIEPISIFVREKGIDGVLDQAEISQGMFRALAIIVHLNHAITTGQSSCVIIDDIGEGLDFERSCALIDLIVEKSKRANVQLIMSTNDQFVMNKVSLKEWSFLQRVPGATRVYNYANSQQLFDDFRFTGLNNFDFLTTGFVDEEVAADGQ